MNVRERLEAIRDATAFYMPASDGLRVTPNPAYNLAAHENALGALHAIDEAETAWRGSGETYRLVPDTVSDPRAGSRLSETAKP